MKSIVAKITCPNCLKEISKPEHLLKDNISTGYVCKCGYLLLFPSINTLKRKHLNK